jgi:hypothetical protein
VFESGVTIQAVVIKGLANDSKLTIDNGARRNLADQLRMQGHPNAILLAAVVNMVWKLQNHYVRTTRTPTIQQALALLKEHPDIEETLPMVGRFRKRFHGSSAVVGGLYYEFSQRDPDAANAFFEQVVEGLGLAKDDPAYALRRYMESSPSNVTMAAVFIKAWNLYLAGEPCGMLVWRPVGKAAEAFPEIKGG